VRVTLLLGVGQFMMQDAVAHSFYPKLLEAGVRIVEYDKTQLHAKVAVVDDEWATVGSSNYDGLSLFVNQEANVVISDAGLCQLPAYRNRSRHCRWQHRSICKSSPVHPGIKSSGTARPSCYIGA